MNKYMVIYHAPAELMAKMADKTPAEMTAGMKPWMDWAAKAGDGLVDMGSPAGNGLKVTKDGTEPSQKDVVGYSVLQAESMEDAVALLQGHPHLEWDNTCDIEVHELMPLPVPVS